jgi:hypothetical protein
MIEKRGNKFVVLSHGGRVLGEHATRKEAIAQLQAVEISKHAAVKGVRGGKGK